MQVQVIFTTARIVRCMNSRYMPALPTARLDKQVVPEAWCTARMTKKSWQTAQAWQTAEARLDKQVRTRRRR